jgi:PHD/YefM family antitoxin component YafN of YafNO toxin-antitoxin module
VDGLLVIDLVEVIKQVHNNKGYIIVEKNGVPVIAVIDADEFEDDLEIHNPHIQRLIRKSYEEYETGKGRQADEFFAELKTALTSMSTLNQRKDVKTPCSRIAKIRVIAGFSLLFSI